MIELVSPDFSDSFFSLRKIKASILPNSRSLCRSTVTGILETGLLFREDALMLEDALQLEAALKKGRGGSILENIKFSPGERIISAIVIGVCVAILPIRRALSLKANIYRSICWTGAGVAVPMLQRCMTPRTFLPFVQNIAEYTFLVRKCISYLKHQLLCQKINTSVSTLNSLLIRQQRELSLIFLNLNSILESQFSWLSTSGLHDISSDEEMARSSTDLRKIHHLFLILQSTFLKNVALAHLTPSEYTVRLHKNHNQRVHWIHSELLPTISESLQNYLIALKRSYDHLKESDIKKDVIPKTLPEAVREPWKYSEIHAEVVACSSRIRSALAKSNDMDSFLEACWKAGSNFSPQVFEADIVALKEELVKSLAAVDSISGRLQKIKHFEISLLERAVQKLQLPAVEEEECTATVLSEESESKVEDQVFYFEKKEDAEEGERPEDWNTAPGGEEIKTTKFVLEELKVKLVKRETEMREREAIALENTMPEYKGRLPTFPSQLINEKIEDPNLALEPNQISEPNQVFEPNPISKKNLILETNPILERKPDLEPNSALVPEDDETDEGAGRTMASLLISRLPDFPDRPSRFVRDGETFAGDGEADSDSDSGNEM